MRHILLPFLVAYNFFSLITHTYCFVSKQSSRLSMCSNGYDGRYSDIKIENSPPLSYFTKIFYQKKCLDLLQLPTLSDSHKLIIINEYNQIYNSRRHEQVIDITAGGLYTDWDFLPNEKENEKENE